ncbi:MAG TPA: alpha-glucan family phosphorylase, partial [Thermodesulfobacteriota bacterium]|nr:alpha-glucan family phosphorylase [Thermodesulfobacteriota bacterium]
HMNEGHASLLTLELLDEEASRAGRKTITHSDIDVVKVKCTFTTHTPVLAGHDQFPLALVRDVLGEREDFLDMKDVFSTDLVRRILRFPEEIHDVKDVFHTENALNMTYLALNLSHYVNGVAKKHGDISRLMFAEYTIDAITNGVHAVTWTAGAFQKLYDCHIPGWRQDTFSLRYALSIPKQEIWNAHAETKRGLIEYINRETNIGMHEDVLTIGYARRAATYKRADLLFADIGRLKSILSKAGPFQVVYAGKAHPQDQGGKEVIKRIFQAKEALKNDVRITYMQNYDMEIGKMMTSGVDVWLNTPQPPLEASGTSGMKAALNGVPSLSVLDGWWIEGCIEGVTGWSIGENGRGKVQGQDREKDAASLYDKLEGVIIPMFYHDRARFIDVMLHCIALNGSFFNSHRMVQQYVLNAYFR